MAAFWRRWDRWLFAALALGAGSLSDRALLLGMPVWILLFVAALITAWNTLTGTWRMPTPAARPRALRLFDHGLLVTVLGAALAVGLLAHGPMFEARLYAPGPPRLQAISPTLVPALAALLVLLIMRAGGRPSPRRMAQLAAALFVVFPALVLVSADVRLTTEFALTPRDGWRLPTYELAAAVVLLGAVVLTARARRDAGADLAPPGALPAATVR